MLMKNACSSAFDFSHGLAAHSSFAALFSTSSIYDVITGKLNCWLCSKWRLDIYAARINVDSSNFDKMRKRLGKTFWFQVLIHTMWVAGATFEIKCNFSTRCLVINYVTFSLNPVVTLLPIKDRANAYTSQDVRSARERAFSEYLRF